MNYDERPCVHCGKSEVGHYGDDAFCEGNIHSTVTTYTPNVKSDLDNSIDSHIKIIEACGKQIEGLLEHCAGVTVHEEIISDEERHSLSIILTYAMEKEQGK
jgi:hypothetical protein